MWYIKNRQWKKDYNEKYYQANKEYWQRKYREALADRRSAHKQIDEYVDEYNKIIDERNTFADEYNKTSREIENSFREHGLDPGPSHRAEYEARIDAAPLKKQADISYDVIKENMERANKDYQWYIDTHKKMSVTEDWSAGAASIRDTGKKLIAKLTGWRR